MHVTRTDDRIARGLGLFSLGLGLAEVAAPDRLARGIGARDDDTTRGALRAAGLRELAHGVGLLTQPHPTGWLWSRVGGDAMDLALAVLALAGHAARPQRLAAVTASLIGVTALDVWSSVWYSRRPRAVGAR